MSVSNDDDDDKDSAIDDDSEPVQPIQVQNVVLRRGTGAKGIKAVNRWSTTSSIDIEGDFEVMANKVQSVIFSKIRWFAIHNLFDKKNCSPQLFSGKLNLQKNSYFWRVAQTDC